MEELKGFEEISQNIPKHVDRFIEKSMDILDRIHEIMEEKNLSQLDIAKRLGKKESEISKWLSGVHNFTLKSIAKLEEALEEELLIVKKKTRTMSFSMVKQTNSQHLRMNKGNRTDSLKYSPIEKSSNSNKDGFTLAKIS